MKNWDNKVLYCSRKCSLTATLFKKGHIPWNKDKEGYMSGELNNMWKGGNAKLQCIVCKNDYEVLPYRVEKSKFCSAICRKEYEKSPESRLHLSEVHQKRVELGLHNLYRGITELKALLRQSSYYKIWRESIFKRDNFKCVLCGSVGKLNADHIKQFAIIIVENEIKTFGEAVDCLELWSMENGRTLCIDCHKKTDTYMRYIPAFSKNVEIKQ